MTTAIPSASQATFAIGAGTATGGTQSINTATKVGNPLQMGDWHEAINANRLYTQGKLLLPAQTIATIGSTDLTATPITRAQFQLQPGMWSLRSKATGNMTTVTNKPSWAIRTSVGAATVSANSGECSAILQTVSRQTFVNVKTAVLATVSSGTAAVSLDSATTAGTTYLDPSGQTIANADTFTIETEVKILCLQSCTLIVSALAAGGSQTINALGEYHVLEPVAN